MKSLSEVAQAHRRAVMTPRKVPPCWLNADGIPICPDERELQKQFDELKAELAEHIRQHPQLRGVVL